MTDAFPQDSTSAGASRAGTGTLPPASGIRTVLLGAGINAGLVVVKLVAGVVGNTYALVADAVESAADIFSSLILWGGLTVAAVPADEDHPFGHGKAEALAAAAVSLMLLGAAAGIAVQAIREIRTPHAVPAPWTLLVLVAVMAIKWLLARRVHAVAAESGSSAVKADAAHHLSDAITSAAAFVGISVALLGSRFSADHAWAAADDWAALVASCVVAGNGITMLRAAAHDLMDRMPGEEVIGPVRRAAESVPGVRLIEQLVVWRVGTDLHVTLHVQADPEMTLDAAHALGGRVKAAIRAASPRVHVVLAHLEPYTSPSDPSR